ncbi:MAG: hypothetical protein FJY82_06615 [Candidatus Aminicenantes bacterium]|nr:hypothetical protein [Candidatus Aminicenantes bacterium]
MRRGAGRPGKAFGLAVVLFAASFVQFLHTESSVFESRDCPACQVNKAGLGVLATSPPVVFKSHLLELIAPVDAPLIVAERIEGLGSRSPPLS